MPGRYLEDFAVGQLFRHEVAKTITEADNMAFCHTTLNPQPLHIDHHFAGESEWGRPLVNSILTLGLVVGQSVQDTTLGTTIGNLGFSQTTFPAPVFHGDTIRCETEVRSVRTSRSKPDRGIVEFEHRGYNQRDELVVSCIRQAMILKTP